MSQPRQFNPLPACPIPIKWDVDGRIKTLQAKIDDPETVEEQKVNLRYAIELWKEGVMPRSIMYIQDGKVVDLDALDFQRPWWMEIIAQIRPIPSPGASSNPTYITMLNDTGRTLHTVFDTYVLLMGLPPNYVGYAAPSRYKHHKWDSPTTFDLFRYTIVEYTG
ncbi:hypothetical protein FQN57_001636 [Myotisia sp. PD_48]|nr:hypothetical protein FQN57_001636 [Myotisia sp. PD_48]